MARLRPLLIAGIGLAATVWVAGALAGTGALTPRGCLEDAPPFPEFCGASIAGLDSPAAIAESPDGRYVYVTSTGDFAILGFKRNRKSGELTPRGCIEDQDFGGDECARQAKAIWFPGGIAISKDGRSAYVTADGPDAVVTFKRNPRSGALRHRGCIEDADTGSGGCSRAAEGIVNPGSPILSPDGRWLYIAANQEVTRFKRNRRTGKLTPRGCIEDNDAGLGDCARATNGLAAVGGLAISPDGRSVYATSSVFGDNALVRLRRRLSNGALRPGGCFGDEDFPLSDACSQEADAIHSPVAVTVSPEGRSVYVAGNADDAVARFARNRRTGQLDYRGCVDDDDSAGAAGCAPGFGLSAVASVAVSADGRSLYATGSDDDSVTWLRRKRSGAILFRQCVEDDDTGPGECAADAPGLDFVRDVIASGNLRSVYTLSLEDDAVAVFKRAR